MDQGAQEAHIAPLQHLQSDSCDRTAATRDATTHGIQQRANTCILSVCISRHGRRTKRELEDGDEAQQCPNDGLQYRKRKSL